MNSDLRPTRVRYIIVAVTAVAALWMYIDRVCFSTLSPNIGAELGINAKDMSFVLGAFFLTYALFQIPIGSLADLYGPRIVLTIAIVAWSLCTAVTSIAGGAAALLAVRLCLGVCEAGAYPAAAGLIRKWSSAAERGRLSAFVAFGGRFGGAVAPALTGLVAINMLGNSAIGVAEWRGVFLIYGILGVLAALAFWLLVRDTPAKHPMANAAEAARVPPAGPVQASPTPWLRRLLALAASRNMWLFGATQFFVNVGWAFLITKMPDYLTSRFKVELTDIKWMQTVPLVASCIGTLCGGFFADLMFKVFGPRWGRVVPIASVMVLCAIMYVVAIQMPTAWGVVTALAIMAFLVDLGVPSIWAFAQDVGGRNVGAALGWGNMWGNFGAAASPVMLQYVNAAFGWDAAFAVCAACFVCGVVTALNLNATIPVSPGEQPLDPEMADYQDA
ncbi:MAG TPA: MFS transporter [Gemmataceae bacterium]|jgi:sugar phosphate permease|nr:MFS transporter [Gemmataceae bacterium]